MGNLTTDLLLDDIGTMFDRLLGWLLKWSCRSKKARLVPLLAPLFVVDEYLSQTMFRMKILYVGWYGALRAVLIKNFND